MDGEDKQMIPDGLKSVAKFIRRKSSSPRRLVKTSYENAWICCADSCCAGLKFEDNTGNCVAKKALSSECERNGAPWVNRASLWTVEIDRD